ncbi:MAG: phosphoribosylformylglycinamidine synthase subunit PurS [Bacteroidetes bacterium]|jgi:phosphoribosylformylglycinamidine synthase|nr:phosphoribosylformylglycinamidine synthase subunit PurS [Bacteroidota bacterium]
MKFLAEIDIMPHKELLDPQGKTVEKNLHHIPVTGVLDIRIGKHIQMLLEAENESEASDKIDLACKKLLANLIMENYTFQIKEVD